MSGRKKHTSKRVINYKEPDILVRVPKPDYDYDHDLADQILRESTNGRGGFAHAKPNGLCHACGKAIPPMRKLCGQCGAKKLHNREMDLSFPQLEEQQEKKEQEE